MNLRLQKLLKLHKLMDKAGEHGSPAGSGEGGAPGGEQTPAAGTQEGGETPAGEGGDPEPAGEQPPAKTDGEPAATKPTDAEAKLLQDVMKHKGRANQLQGELEALRKKLNGVDLDQYQAMVREREEKARKELEDRGEYERIVAQMGERHTQAMQEHEAKLQEATQTISGLQLQISELTVGNAFATSPLIGEEVMLTRAKARAVYGSHFDFVDGKIVAFDKPKGAAERTMLVKASGEPMNFNDALLHLVNNDPDPERDRLIRSRAKPGAGSTTASTGNLARKVSAQSRDTAKLTPAERIAQGLRQQAAKV